MTKTMKNSKGYAETVTASNHIHRTQGELRVALIELSEALRMLDEESDNKDTALHRRAARVYRRLRKHYEEGELLNSAVNDLIG